MDVNDLHAIDNHIQSVLNLNFRFQVVPGLVQLISTIHIK
jgi:hypothetical protein